MITDYVKKAYEDKASDIHLVSNLTPRYRIDGSVREMSDQVITPSQCEEMVKNLAGSRFEEGNRVGELDMCATIAGVRCRLNLFLQQGGWSMAIRLLSDKIPDIKSLGLPPVAQELPFYNQGLVLITGETGSGKSTTLASILNQINLTQAKHILTLEDPVEYVYKPEKCVINQREIGKDTKSFATGLRAALREDPDVILVGEMRDLETIETALIAAETGHLVFGTVHTNSAADSVDRIVDVFPGERQQQIRLQLSMTLKAVLSQQLLPKKSGSGRALACEVMKTDGAIRNLIREGKTPQIYNSIQTTGNIGNILMDKALLNLYEGGVISRETYEGALSDSGQKQKLPGGAMPGRGRGFC